MAHQQTQHTQAFFVPHHIGLDWIGTRRKSRRIIKIRTLQVTGNRQKNIERNVENVVEPMLMIYIARDMHCRQQLVKRCGSLSVLVWRFCHTQTHVLCSNQQYNRKFICITLKSLKEMRFKVTNYTFCQSGKRPI